MIFVIAGLLDKTRCCVGSLSFIIFHFGLYVRTISTLSLTLHSPARMHGTRMIVIHSNKGYPLGSYIS